MSDKLREILLINPIESKKFSKPVKSKIKLPLKANSNFTAASSKQHNVNDLVSKFYRRMNDLSSSGTTGAGAG